ncbi:MAG: vancomycin resistance histidine kinase VanS [Oscillospiraceae bacterium]
MSVALFSKFVITYLIYVAAIFLLYLFAFQFFHFFTWYEDNFLYRLLSIINHNTVPIFILLFVIGFIVILLYYWQKVIGYLQDIVSATENIYSDDVGIIKLSGELAEIENQLNQIKFNAVENKRIAREAEQRKNDLVVYLAHDLKTPLTSVIGYLTLLRDEKQISAETCEKYLSISLDKAERLEDLINEFFEITRFNLSEISLEYSRVNLTRMLEQLIFEFQPMLCEKKLCCNLTAQPDIMVRCDIDKLQRVFDNLLRNAVNYSFNDSTINIIVGVCDRSLQIDFINHGNTIASEKLNRIFEQFYRIDTSRATKSGGAGLGLAISKEVVELHGGSITAFSENEIISFSISLPMG